MLLLTIEVLTADTNVLEMRLVGIRLAVVFGALVAAGMLIVPSTARAGYLVPRTP